MFVDVRNFTLSEWLDFLFYTSIDEEFIDYAFPTREMYDEYIAGIQSRSDEEIIALLKRFLLPSTSLLIDEHRLETLAAIERTDRDWHSRLLNLQYYQRLIVWTAMEQKGPPPWEGITWILDLLPHGPRRALNALNAYLSAHIQLLPDGRIDGLFEAAEIIRAKYIGLPGTQPDKVRGLLDLSDRDFECVVERLYSAMRFETELTPPKRDGGRDVIATKKIPGDFQSLRIECKRYKNPVGVDVARGLLGVVSSEKATKGVVVSASRFTKGARDFAMKNPRIELISGDEFVRLLNEYKGATWPLHIDRLIIESLNKGT